MRRVVLCVQIALACAIELSLATPEYACHEGNFGLLDILKGARYDEQKAK